MSAEQIFGQQMRRLRKARGMSQLDLCRALTRSGVPPHQTTISKIESADRPLRLDEAAEIAAALGTDLNSMVGNIGAEPDAAVFTHLARIAELEGALAGAQRVLATAQRALTKAGGQS
jgi:transcriptional regulator with XRE-family HTH domain